jgi:hypothetical protein
LTALFVGIGLLFPAASDAQQRYQPSRPTVSPYLNLFRENNGVIPNYQSLVRPMLQQQAINQYQGQLLQQQNRRISQLQTGQSQLEQAASPTGKGGAFNRMGSSSTFQNTSRFYPGAGFRTR